ncbi:MAG: hypothetical protein ACXVW3_06370 [Nocardioidaceae bacterium]
MSEQSAPARPVQVTAAGAAAIAGSVLLVVALFEAMGQVRSSETRDAVQEFLTGAGGSGLGLSAGGLLALLRAAVLFNGAVAAASAVLGVFVLLRHNAARILLTVAAVLMLFTAPLAGGVLPFVVAFAASTLWSRPARDWFAGRQPTPPAAFRTPAARPASSAQDPDPGWAPPEAGTAVPSPYPAPVPGRPPTVLAAAVLTWLFAGITAFGGVITVAMLMTAQDQFVTDLRRNPSVANLHLATSDLLGLLWVTVAVTIFWCLCAMVLAVLAFRGVAWARVPLAVSAGMAGVVSLLAFPVGLVHVVAAVATVVLLFAGGAEHWFARRTSPYAEPPRPPQTERRPPNVW